MAVLLTGTDGYLQLIASLLVFVVVLAAALFSTKWLANYQKGVRANGNIEVMESTQLTTNKYIQIVRIGEKYLAIAVCKDTVTVLCEIPVEELKSGNKPEYTGPDFKSLLSKFKNKLEQSEVDGSVDGTKEQTDEQEISDY